MVKLDYAAIQQEAQDIQDLRDDVVSVIRNSGLTYDEIHARGGATARTIQRWTDDKNVRPQLPTIRGTLRACGHDLIVTRSNVVSFKGKR